MRRLVSNLTFAIVLGASVSIACGDDDDSSDGHGGSAGKSGVGGNKASGGTSAGGSGEPTCPHHLSLPRCIPF